MKKIGLPAEFKLEPTLGALELDYRQHFLNVDIEQSAFGIWIGIAAVLALSYIDFLFFHLTKPFYYLLLIRIGFVILSIAIMAVARRAWDKKDPVVIDVLILTWWLMVDIAILSIDYFRPPTYVQNQTLYVLAAFTCYSVFPVRLYARAIPAIFLSVMDILFLLFLKSPLPVQSFNIILATTVIAHAIGLLTSTRLNTYRRMQYLAQTQEVKARQELEKLAVTDELTGLVNRRRFIELMDIELKRCRRYQVVFTLLMIDFDNFKSINDTYGHPAGDDVLRQFATALGGVKRCTDISGRLGGDELTVLLPETCVESAGVFADRLREISRQIKIMTQLEAPVVTISIGITQVRAEDSDVFEILQRVDQALYRAKRGGRDRYEIA